MLCWSSEHNLQGKTDNVEVILVNYSPSKRLIPQRVGNWDKLLSSLPEEIKIDFDCQKRFELNHHGRRTINRWQENLH